MLSERFADWLIDRALRREPDFVIGGPDRPYLLRWWLFPWRAWVERSKSSPSRLVRAGGRALALLPNAYLHRFCRSDDDRALHDHPWLFNASWLLRGRYIEWVFSDGPGSAPRAEFRRPYDLVFRWGKAPHRVELLSDGWGGEAPVWTLFITGPNVREWGFYCDRGFVHWKAFTAANDKGQIGRGCDQ